MLKQKTNVLNVDMNGNMKNGYKVVSTFSGGGGSCLGYKMAGYDVIWANEFIEEAQKTYEANFPNTYLNKKDIREVTVDEILEQTGLKVGELDLLDGSPPCSAFSLAGVRQKGWGKVKKYSDKKQRVDDLFYEYIRILKGLQPKVFVAENVKGLTIGSAKGVFKQIMSEMKSAGYVVYAKVINMKYLGVPQSRERCIFEGVRNDIHEKYGLVPQYPARENHIVTLGEALDGVRNNPEEVKMLLENAKKYRWGKVLEGITKDPSKHIQASKVMKGSYFNLIRESFREPCSTICQTGGLPSASGNCHPIYDRKFTIAELKRITSLPDDFVLTGKYEKQWERCGRMVPPLGMMKISKTIQEEILDKIK